MFSGSDTATSAGLQGFAGPFVDGGEDGWNGVGVGWSGVSTISTNISVTSSDAEVTIDGSSFNLSRVRYGNNLSGFLAISTDNSSDIRFNDGDVVSWSGSFDVAIDVDDVSSFSNNEFGDLDLQFTVIPEPSSFLLVGVGVAAVGFRRRLALGKTNAQE
ncbi:MAG: PEP-CTERM sorting domain-containing protein [Planctomycetales bacterium]